MIEMTVTGNLHRLQLCHSYITTTWTRGNYVILPQGPVVNAITKVLTSSTSTFQHV